MQWYHGVIADATIISIIPYQFMNGQSSCPILELSQWVLAPPRFSFLSSRTLIAAYATAKWVQYWITDISALIQYHLFPRRGHQIPVVTTQELGTNERSPLAFNSEADSWVLWCLSPAVRGTQKIQWVCSISKVKLFPLQEQNFLSTMCQATYDGFNNRPTFNDLVACREITDFRTRNVSCLMWCYITWCIFVLSPHLFQKRGVISRSPIPYRRPVTSNLSDLATPHQSCGITICLDEWQHRYSIYLSQLA